MIGTMESTARESGRTAAGNAEPIVIIGGGISGVALAVWLRELGRRAIVLEKSAGAGGVIESRTQDGFTFDLGPNTVLDKFDSFGRLLEIAGLGGEVSRAPVREHARYIWHGGRLHEVPSGPGALIGSRLLTARAKLRALREFWVKPEAQDEDLRRFVVRRLGSEVYERAFLPMVQGIWAGAPEKMSVEAAFPALKRMERESGSLLRALIFPPKQPGGETKPKRRAAQMVSLRGGMWRLTGALEKHLGEDFRAETEVRSIAREGSGYRVSITERGGASEIRASRVIVSAPAEAAANCIEGIEPELAATFRGVAYCPLIVVGLGVPAENLRLPPGFGFLAAREQGLRILGAIFNSNFMPDRAPEGHAALTVMIGGELDPEGANLSDLAVADLLRADLGRALGWDGRSSTIQIKRWHEAIPRYGLNHAALCAAIDAAEARNPGLHFFGNWRGGPALADRIELASGLAERLALESAEKGQAARAC